MFNEHGIKIIVEANIKIANCLDFTLYLNKGMYSPYMKTNNTLHYVHSKSNHPTQILNNIPKAVNKFLASILSDANAINKKKTPYQVSINTN